jgi:hypothetical protein
MKLLKTVLPLLFVQVYLTFYVTSTPQGQDFLTLESENLIIRYPPDLERTAYVIQERYDIVVREIEHTFHLRVDFIPEFVILNNRMHFRQLAGSDLTVAFAVPHHKVIVIDHTRLIMDRIPLGETIRHELIHLLLHNHISTEHLPRWLDEGIAQWASDGLGELIHPPDKSILRRALHANTLLLLSDLEKSFPPDREGVLLAYRQSKEFVEFLVNRNGVDTLRMFLRLLSSGKPLDNALEQTYGASLDFLEGEWHTRLRDELSVWMLLSNNLDTLLFLFAAFLVIAAGIRMFYMRYRISDDLP